MEQQTKFQEFENQFNEKMYDKVWTERFNFFKKNGGPATTTYKKAYKEMDGIVNKLRININFYAFFFGFIYFLIKGMYKGALTLLGIFSVLFIIMMFIPDTIADTVDNAIGITLGILAGMTANYTFYRKEVLDEDDFNIFKGVLTK